MSDIVDSLRARSMVSVPGGISTTLLWFVIANLAVLLTLYILSVATSDDDIWMIWPFVLGLGCVMPFLMLAFSKYIARGIHKMYRVESPAAGGSYEAKLLALVDVLARRAGLLRIPEVWIYRSDDMNAFATGPSKNSAMLGVSDTLLSRMDDRSTAAILAHEIGHIANGDMLTMAVVQSVVNMITLLITIPLWMMNLMASCLSGPVGALSRWMIQLMSWLITSIVFVLGLIVVLFFSRKREYAADALAAKLVDADSMIQALRILDSQNVPVPVEQRAFATFKIYNPPGWAIVFSSHPSIESRIQKLYEAKPY